MSLPWKQSGETPCVEADFVRRLIRQRNDLSFQDGADAAGGTGESHVAVMHVPSSGKESEDGGDGGGGCRGEEDEP